VELWFFWQSLGIGLAVAAPVGPMSLMCIHRTLDRGQLAGFVFGSGIAAADLTYAAIAAFGISAVSALLLSGTTWIKLIGSALLIVLGTRIAFTAPRTAGGPAQPASWTHAFLTAYALTMTNPPTIVFFASLFAAVASMKSVAQSFTFAAGVFAGSLLWWLLLTALVARSARLIRPPVLAWINRLSGLFLIGIAVQGLASLA
jgi:threonine/homoserine/homoserine lactone efflux protein